MKKITLLLTSFFVFLIIHAQNGPKGMKYQAVARSTNGTLLANESIQLRISLYSESNSKTLYYTEVHTIITGSTGLFDLVIGEGKPETGLFSKVPWSTQDIWMGISIKEKNKTDYLSISNSKLLAVPYAFHAATASQLVSPMQAAGSNFKVDDGVPSANWSLKGNSRSDAAVDKLGTTDYMDLVLVTNNIDRLRITADGNISLKKSLAIGEDLDVFRNARLNITSGSTTNYGPFTVEKLSPTVLTGTLAVNNATTLKSTLGVTGVTNLNSILNVNNASATNLSGVLTVTGASLLKGSLLVDGASYLKSTLDVTGDAILKGALNVAGPAAVQSSLEVTGATTLGNTTNVQGQVNITTNLSGGESAKAAYPLTVQGSDQGIAISVNGNGQNNKNFITFWDATAIKGRIEGQTLPEAQSGFDYVWNNIMGAFAIALPTAEAIACGFNVPPDLAEVASNGVAAASATANLIVYNERIKDKYGVAFESGSGDYAEWLEKKDLSEKFSYGDIVGVQGGKISKNTTGANHLMVVSMAPIVLGNMPPSGRSADFEKIAFMGQVQVKVLGSVNIGDYIIPSGSDDGFGRAVNADNMSFELFAKVVGRAWSSSINKNGFSMVNVAVGLTTNELASKISTQQNVINDLRNQVASISSYLAAKDPAFKPVSDLPANTIVSSRTGVGINSVETKSLVLTESSKYLDIMINNVKEICLKNGIDINKYDQVKRLFNDKKYLIEILQKN